LAKNKVLHQGTGRRYPNSMVNQPMNLYDDMMRTRCPGSPEPPKRKRSPRKNLEAGVIRDCIGYLHKSRRVIYVERRNTGAIQFTDGSRVAFGSKGAADIWCLIGTHRGTWPRSSYVLRHVEIECKRRDGKGVQSQAQKDFQAFCDANHIPYLLVTSAEELTEKLRDILA